MGNVLSVYGYVLEALADVRLGEIEYFDLPDTYDQVTSFDQVREICDLYSQPGPHGVSINLFVVQEITMTAGFSGGIPGPPGVFGTPASGVVAYDLTGSAATMGVTLAHETGHFLGLEHTSELDLSIDEVVGEDAISDTPVCDSGLLPAYIDCPDYPNLMFPFFRTTGLEVSVAQAGVVRGNAMLYEIDRAATCASAGAVYDVTAAGWASSDTAALADDFAGACGGGGAPERVHLYRLRREGLAELEVSVLGSDFAPLLYVRQGDCGDAGAEVACVSGDAGVDVTAAVEAPAPGAYYLFVDGRYGVGGTFTLRVTEIE